MTATEELLTPEEVADILRIQPSTFATWRRKGKGPKPTPLGYKVVRYRRADVDDWIRAQQKTD